MRAVDGLADTLLPASMAHDLRTPLHGVLGMVELLRDTRLDAEQRGYVDTLGQSAESLLAAVEAALDLSRIEGGSVALEHRSFSPLRVAQDVFDLLRPQAESKGLAFLLWAGPLPERLAGDPARLQQVWMNLLSHAIRATARGEVRLALQAAPQADGRTRLHGTVSGGDMAAAAGRGRAAEAFLSAPDASDRVRAGLAMPRRLRLATRLAALMDGEVAADEPCTPGTGVRIRFSMRFDADGRAAPAIPLDRLRVLVAEDNPVNQALALASLRRLGVCAELVADGSEAVRAVAERGVDVVLMDLRMPGLDGVAAARAIRALPPGRAQPWIVAVTADVGPEDRRHCVDAGVDAFIAKPFRLATLRDALLAARPHGPRATPPDPAPDPAD